MQKRYSTMSPHIEWQIYIKANFRLRSWIAAGSWGVFQSNQKKSIFKMQKLCNGTKGIWDLLEFEIGVISTKAKWFDQVLQNGFTYLSRCYANTWTMNIGHTVHCSQGLLLLIKDNVGLIWHLGLSLRVHHCCFMNSPTHPFPRQKKRSF